MAASLEDEIRVLRERFWSERDPEGRVFAPLADAHRRAGELDEAAELVEDGLSRHPDFAPGHLVSARTLRDRGDEEGAAAAYRRALELDPENVEALREAAAVAEARDRTARALELLHRLARLEPEDPEIRERVRELKRRHFEVRSPGEAAAPEVEAPSADAGGGPTAAPDEVREPGAGEQAAAGAGQAETVPEAEGEGTEVYTRTMAELYARQGLVERAVAIYRRLVDERPDDEELRTRLEELESEAREREGPETGAATGPEREAAPERERESEGEAPAAPGGGGEDVEELARELAEGPEAADDLASPFAWSGDEEEDEPAADEEDEPGSAGGAEGRSIASYFGPMLEWPSGDEGGQEEGR